MTTSPLTTITWVQAGENKWLGARGGDHAHDPLRTIELFGGRYVCEGTRNAYRTLADAKRAAARTHDSWLEGSMF